MIPFDDEIGSIGAKTTNKSGGLPVRTEAKVYIPDQTQRPVRSRRLRLRGRQLPIGMKCYQANSGEGLAGLALREVDEPTPQAREVLVRVRANSLNFRELSILRGTYPLPVKSNVVMAADGAGEVIEVGEGVSRVKVGDRVAAAMFPRWIDGPISWEYAPQIGGSLDGMLAEMVVLDEQAVVPIPAHLSFEEAATFPCAGVTAWNALTGGWPLMAGDTVLTIGSGGVSLFALQFAKLFGARVIATTSSDEKALRLRALGADGVINYREKPEWHLAVRELTGGRGVDLVIETGGGTLEQSIKSVTLDGQVAFIGRLDEGTSSLDTNVLYNAVATVRVIFAGSRGHFVAMNRAVSENKLRPVIDRIFDFNDVPAAFRYYQKKRPFGKVVIRRD
jgi:NADPH:quinone reductase-like Zn-dependent oxidoreductase